MITSEAVANHILDYLNGQIGLDELVAWSEDAIITFTESDQRPPNADQVWKTLLYLGAADTPDFPMTWEVIRGFLEDLGRPVQSVMA